jgi:endoglucanase
VFAEGKTLKKFILFIITAVMMLSVISCGKDDRNDENDGDNSDGADFDYNYADIVSSHGQLSVKGPDLVDKNGNPYQLRGMSTHGIQWYPHFINKSGIQELRDDWKINVLRLALYTGENEDDKEMWQHVENGIQICIELDMYVMIDWHVLHESTPLFRRKEAAAFFEYFSKKYGDRENIIYEICNEPNPPATWENDIKPYAREIIPIIRKNAPNSVIIVGTEQWSQGISDPLNDSKPLKFDNIMYALHFYAASHKDGLRNSLKKCYQEGLPVFVTEFGMCKADGGGKNNFEEAEKWLNLLDEYNISYINWNFANRYETSSALKPGASATGGWTENDFSVGGAWIREHFRNRAAEE